MSNEHSLEIITNYIPRCGDTVFHKPTGERWIVAYADAERDELAWCGWPEGLAKLSDCEVVEKCSDASHQSTVLMWKKSSDGPRRERVKRMFGAAIGWTVEADNAQ